MSDKLPQLFANLPRRADASAKCVAFDMILGVLTPNGGTPWIASVGLGTPPQQVNLMVDTGTENSWVTSMQCTTQACLAHGRFAPNSSTSFRAVDFKPQTVSFGPWGNMTVVIGKDVFTLKQVDPGRPSVVHEEPLRIQLATQYDGLQFQGLACDGGLAIPSVPVADKRELPGELLPQLIQEGLIEHPLVSFGLNAKAHRGECLFGAVDETRFDPDTVQILPLVEPPKDVNYLWDVELNEFRCGVEVVLQNVQLALDSGSSWFKGSEQLISKLRNAVTKNWSLPAEVKDRDQLADYPDITLVLHGKPYRLTPEQYFLQIPPGGHTWVLGFNVLQGMPEDVLLVGSLFLDTVYSAFYYGDGCRSNQAILLASPR